MSRTLRRAPSLDLLKGFVAVARRMSITQAADDLCVTQSAVSKQVRALEQSLGVPLLERGHRRIELTAAGQRLFEVADRALDAIVSVTESFVPEGRRPVTVSASMGVAGLWLVPRLQALHERVPQVDVRVAADNRLVPLGLAGVDVAIRYCSEQSVPPGAVRLFGEQVWPVQAPRLALADLDARSLSRTILLELEDARHPWLQWGPWLARRGLTLRQAKGVLRFSHYDQLIHAAIDGQGAALGRLPLLAAWVCQGQLAPIGEIVPALADCGHAYWLVTGDEPPRRPVAQVIDWLTEQACDRFARPTPDHLDPGGLTASDGRPRTAH